MPFRLLFALLLAAVVLTGCKSSEEKAEQYYQSGLELLEAGDPDRAAVEFRNVFRYVGEHRNARRQLAQILLARGDVGGAYSQYLRLAEQYPEDADIRRALARIAIEQRQWDEAERHGRKAIALDPEPAEAKAIGIALEYREAVIAKDTAARDSAASAARSLLESAPDSQIARRVAISYEIDQGRKDAALEDLEAALEREPDSLEFNMVKLQILVRLDRTEETGAQLRDMASRFPENEDIRKGLIDWYLRQKDYDGAEAYLRELAGPPTGPTDGHLTVIGFLEAARGREAALAEVDSLIDANTGEETDNAALYRSIKANYAFQDGDRSGAIAQMEQIIEGAEPSDQIRLVRNALAQMLLATGNQVGARAQVEEVLNQDASNVTALKLRARLLIDSDQPEAAIIDLRRALDQAPRDTSTILLLAEAHERNGSRELQGERLASAFEISNGGAEESLHYAAFLLREERRDAAQKVLTDARAANPDNLEILTQLAQMALEDRSVGLVQDIAADLERLGRTDERAAALATSLRASLLLREDRLSEGIALLEGQAGEKGDNTAAVLAILRAQLSAGHLDTARTYLDGLLEKSPEDPALRLINASLSATEGKTGEAETMLRQLIAENPEAEAPVHQLYTLLRSQERTKDAAQILEAALRAQPDSRTLQLMRASELEAAGDTPGAVAIYQALYDKASGDTVVANNLASLLAETGDPQSLERAALVARRLRGTEVPAMQDTYGWIAYRQGHLDEALGYLEPAAAAMTDNVLVQYHLGMTYLGLERLEKARDTLSRAIALGGDNPPPQIDTAREALAALDAPPAEPAPDTGAQAGAGTGAGTETSPDAKP